MGAQERDLGKRSQRERGEDWVGLNSGMEGGDEVGEERFGKHELDKVGMLELSNNQYSMSWIGLMSELGKSVGLKNAVSPLLGRKKRLEGQQLQKAEGPAALDDDILDVVCY
ncbi:hypothetical protein ACH5RR_007274 [Cinchona calisaya]|uniref:Uncharacterized protein n=1 Tax=Cinchona calisaya TaxID=153742 RepID=A0ABD3ARC3_9GENT